MSTSGRLSSAHPGLAPLTRAGFGADRIDAILAFYDEPHRRYHDRDHVREMLDVAVDSGVALSPAQALAVLLHDAIYVPGAPRGVNESMSAQLLRVYGAGVDARLIDHAAAIVIDTADHVSRHPDADLVLDLDLLRLAVPATDFERHSRQLFAEQRNLIGIDDDAAAWQFFQARRAPFFQRLVDRPAIYSTAPILARCEVGARRNLAHAIRALDVLGAVAPTAGSPGTP